MAHAVDLSVLLPVYAGARPNHFAAALESLVMQTRPADEVLVVEDGPLPDKHRELLAWAADRLPLRRFSLPRSGLGPALAAGLEAAEGTWVARMDADDIALPERFERQLKAIEADAYDVMGSAMYEFEDDPARPLALRRMPTKHRDIAGAMVRLNPVNHPTVIFRAEAARLAGGYRQLEGLEDYDLWARMLANGAHFGNLPEPLVLFRADEALRNRRRDAHLFLNELKLQRNLVCYGVVTRRQALTNALTRNTARLLPGRFTANLVRRYLAQRDVYGRGRS